MPYPRQRSNTWFLKRWPYGSSCCASSPRSSRRIHGAVDPPWSRRSTTGATRFKDMPNGCSHRR